MQKQKIFHEAAANLLLFISMLMLARSREGVPFRSIPSQSPTDEDKLLEIFLASCK